MFRTNDGTAGRLEVFSSELNNPLLVSLSVFWKPSEIKIIFY